MELMGINIVVIGGGTPSVFSAESIHRLLSGVRALVRLQPEAEITLEANPGTFEREKFQGFKEAGINRLSIGVQSFNDAHLAAIGRIHNAAEAHAAIDDMLLGNKMGNAGARVVIEDFLQGEEASFIVMSDGDNVLPMATSQDHKRLLDSDKGPNTGGMGAYSPAPVVSDAVYQRVMDEIILPTVRGMKADGIEFTGFLYAGLMIDAAGAPRTIEFNCRFGDPETQPIMSRLDSDLVDLVEAALNRKLDSASAQWKPQTAVGVVLAAQNYPDTPKKGDVIHGIDAANQIGKVFHAGTALNERDEVITNGGRVLCVVGLGDDVAAAKQRAYRALAEVRFDGMQYRTDIADKAMGR